MKDIFKENLFLYKILHALAIILNSAIVILIILILTGYVKEPPTFFIEVNFVIKLIFALFLVYRFNIFSSNKLEITSLDKEICFSIGLYIIVLSIVSITVRNSQYFKQVLNKNNISNKTVDYIHIL